MTHWRPFNIFMLSPNRSLYRRMLISLPVPSSPNAPFPLPCILAAASMHGKGKGALGFLMTYLCHTLHGIILCKPGGLLPNDAVIQIIIQNRSLDRQEYIFVTFQAFQSAFALPAASCLPLCLDVARYAFYKGDCQSARRQDEITLDSNDRFGIMREKKYECP